MIYVKRSCNVFVLWHHYDELLLYFVVGKVYDIVSNDFQEPDEVVFLNYPSEPKIGMYLKDYSFFPFILIVFFLSNIFFEFSPSFFLHFSRWWFVAVLLHKQLLSTLFTQLYNFYSGSISKPFFFFFLSFFLWFKVPRCTFTSIFVPD